MLMKRFTHTHDVPGHFSVDRNSRASYTASRTHFKRQSFDPKEKIMTSVQTVQWRPEVNAMTTPQSWRPLHLPRSSNGSNELAARIAQKHPALDAEMVKTTLAALVEEIQIDLINGNQSVLTDAFTFRVSLNARLDTPDAPLPPVDDVLNVRVIVSRAFLKEVRRNAQLERLPPSEKLPLISAAQDTVLKLDNVLNPQGMLRLTGTDLFFDPDDEGSQCVLEGTRSGKTVQRRFGSISNTEVSILPDIPAQTSPWNNEYQLSIATHYTENGTLRTGIYRRKLRTPLTVPLFGHPHPPETGILTDKAAAPYVTVTGGTLSADETVRIQVILDLHANTLAFNVLDMTEGGKAGAAVQVTANGAYVLQGFAGSALTSLNVTVNNYAELVKMIRSGYSGRLVDVLVVKTGS
jgi:hypothetical protein